MTPKEMFASPDDLKERDAFYRKYRLLIHALSSRRFNKREDAEELESIVWRDIFKNFSEFQMDNPRPLLQKVLRWRANDLYRQKYRAVRQNEELVSHCDDLLLGLMDQASTSSLSQEDRLSLHNALTQESKETRELLVARYVEGKTWEELASQYQLHRNTLLKRTNAAIKRLRQQLTETI
jgi:RNA polymerase sigma factor (sigma-70 family)